MDFLFCSIIYLNKRGGYMGKTDTIKAQKIVSSSKSNLVSNTPYHENSFIYRTTNEQINKYQDFLKNRENTLSIIASGIIKY